MKRILVILALFVFVSILFTSCKTAGHCPAYAKTTTEQPAKNI